jgi:Trk K+ transport system NAD-binding subunit
MALGLVRIKVPVNSCYCGMSLNDLKLPKSCFLVGLIRGDRIILASAEPTIHYEDDLLGISLNSAQITELKFTLQKTHPIYYSFDECLLNNQLNNSTIPVRSF